MLYRILQFGLRVGFWLSHRIHIANAGNAPLDGGYLLASNHSGHMDPFCLSTLLSRKVGWMARAEFFGRGWAAWLMRSVHAFPVNRQGVPVSAMRMALRRLGAGEVVGVFPEGELRRGTQSVARGGKIKQGICLLAARSGRPVLPCIIVGADKLNAPGPWFPFRGSQLWVIYGRPIHPELGATRRIARQQMAARIESAFVELYAQLQTGFGVSETELP